MKRWIAGIVLAGLALSLTACAEKEAAAEAVAEPLIKLSGSTVIYSDQEILCH